VWYKKKNKNKSNQDTTALNPERKENKGKITFFFRLIKPLMVLPFSLLVSMDSWAQLEGWMLQALLGTSPL
jgi:hypothetical protein